MAPLRKKASIDDPTKLSGVEKAAVVLLALGEEHAGLWEALDDEEEVIEEVKHSTDETTIEGFEGWTIHMIRDFVACMDLVIFPFIRLVLLLCS